MYTKMIGQRSTIRIALLDSNREHIAYEWSFSSLGHDVVRIGRSHENDVVISDVYVSVGEIADSEYFRKLREIRQTRDADETAQKLHK